MQSVMRTVPVGRVELGLEHQGVLPVAAAGRHDARLAPRRASCQKPCVSLPSRAAKHDGESKWGRHSQSMEPSVPTRAAVCRSPITA